MKRVKLKYFEAYRITVYYVVIAAVLVFFEHILFSFSFTTPLFIWLNNNKVLLFFVVSVYLVYRFSSIEIINKNFAIQQLNEQEQKYLQLFNNANDAIMLIEGNKVIDCNNKTFDLLKRNKFQVINKSLSELSAVNQTNNESSYEKFESVIKQLNSDSSFGTYWLFASPEGNLIDASITLTQIEILGKSFIQLIAKDISTRVKDKLIIKESERKYKEIVDNANSAIVKFDLQGRITFINEFAENIFAYKAEDILGRYIFEVFWQNPKPHEFTKNETRRLMRRILRNITIQPTQEHWNYTKKGKRVFMSWTSKPIYDNYKNLVGVLSIGTDQTDNKIIYDRLTQSQEKFNSVFNEIVEGITILSMEGEIIEQNAAALEFLGLKKSDFGSQNSTKSKLRSLIPHFDELIKYVKEKGEISFEADMVSASNEYITAELNTKIIRYGDQSVIIAVSRDITERKNQQQHILNAALEAEENERSRVAKELHDSVSPILSASKLYTQTLQDTESEELKTKIVGKIESSIDETIQTVYEISNNLSPHILENFGLVEAVNSFIDKIPANKISIELKSNLKERLLKTHEIALYRVVTELINNSLKHASAKTISLNINRSNNIELEYKDDGVGFDVNQVMTTSKGMGIFNISNRISSLNGSINIVSERGNGINVKVIIPLE